MFNPSIVRSWRLGVLLLGLATGWVGLRAQNAPAPPPASPKVEAPSSAQVDPNAAPQPIDPRVYEIGAEDQLRVLVWQQPELSGVHSVRPDGKITLPLVGDVQAEGLTPNRLDTALTEALKDFVEFPDVTVSVLQVNSRSYWVNGFVNRSGKYPLVTPIKVYQAISIAGGFREYANKKDIIIMRGDTQRIKFNADDYQKGKNPEKNIFIENGDIIEVHD